MINHDLYDEICELIDLGTEGDYWDFKQKWPENAADLLHDIICMANNLVDRDSYIIIGVTDSRSPNGVQVCGVPSEHRKSQQNLIDMLKDKKFAGGLRPTVYVHTIEIAMNIIDIIIIRNNANTPYFLVEPFNYGSECVRSGHIYTRIGDTNTPKTAFADIDKVEYLWRKKFGIDLSINKRLLLLLERPDEWEGNLDEDNIKFHSIFPEFQVRLVKIEEDQRENSIIINLSDNFPDKSVLLEKVEIYYHSTLLYKRDVIYLDGYRHLIPFPDTDTVYLGKNRELNRCLTYLYFNHSSITGKLFNCLTNCDDNWYNSKWKLNPGVAFLQFIDDSDRIEFEAFVTERLPNLLVSYMSALTTKGYVESQETFEYFNFGWSKANELKSRYLFEQYRGNCQREIADYIPSLPNCLT